MVKVIVCTNYCHFSSSLVSPRLNYQTESEGGSCVSLSSSSMKRAESCTHISNGWHICHVKTTPASLFLPPPLSFLQLFWTGPLLPSYHPPFLRHPPVMTGAVYCTCLLHMVLSKCEKTLISFLSGSGEGEFSPFLALIPIHVRHPHLFPLRLPRHLVHTIYHSFETAKQNWQNNETKFPAQGWNSPNRSMLEETFIQRAWNQTINPVNVNRLQYRRRNAEKSSGKYRHNQICHTSALSRGNVWIPPRILPNEWYQW